VRGNQGGGATGTVREQKTGSKGTVLEGLSEGRSEVDDTKSRGEKYYLGP